MELIYIPRRYRCPDPAWKIGTVTDERQRNIIFLMYLGYVGLYIKDGKAVRNRRIVRSFMQVYSVQFLECDKEELGQICGKIFVGGLSVFDRQTDKVSRHDFDHEGCARLTGPFRCLDAECDILINPRVFRKNEPLDFFNPQSGIIFDEWGGPVEDVTIPDLDTPGLYGKYLFENRTMMSEYNRLLSRELMTTCGRLKVNYATFDDAAEGFLTVRVVEWRGEGHMLNVYGRICTSDTLLCDDGAKSVVFDLKRDESQRVRPLQYICMRRPVTVVPMGQFLKVEVDVRHKNMMSSGDDDDDDDVVIASGVRFFKARSTKDDAYENEPEEYEDQSTDEDEYGEDESDDEVDQFTDSEDPLSDEEGSSLDEEGSSSDDKDQSEESDEQYAAGGGEDQSADGEDQSKHEIADEPQTIDGDWGKIELRVYWLPCWCRGHYEEDLRSI